MLIHNFLLIQALLQLPYLNTLYGFSLKLLRYADTTTLASLIRADWTFYSSHPALFLSTYLVHGLLVDYFEKKRRCGIMNQEDSTTNLEWLASLWDWYTSYLLHPIASLQQFPSDHSDWEDDPNFLFERLAFPDLWLRPLVNVDYIKLLPTWRLRAVGQKERVSGIQQDNDSESQDLLDHSRHSEHRQLCQQDSNTDAALSSDTRPVCSCPCAHAADVSTSCCQRNGSAAAVEELLEDSPVTTPGISSCQQYDWSQWPSDMLLCSECVVCLENFVGEELLMGLPCGHAFHQQCIVVWLAAGRHCCPVCRWPSYKKKKDRATPSSTNESIHLD